MAVEHNAQPEQIIREAILKRIRHSEVFKSQEDKDKVINEHQSAYVLKVAGSDQYFLKSCPVSQYKYIQACVAKDEVSHRHNVSWF